ncbi:MAG: hypothetical protein ABIF77_16870 [bacterium]
MLRRYFLNNSVWAACLLFLLSLGILGGPNPALATDRVVLGELFSRDG